MKIFKRGTEYLPLGAGVSLGVPGLTECKIDDPEPEKFVRLDELLNAPVLGYHVKVSESESGRSDSFIAASAGNARIFILGAKERGFDLAEVSPLIAGVAK